jgi:hypothetical protein
MDILILRCSQSSLPFLLWPPSCTLPTSYLCQGNRVKSILSWYSQLHLPESQNQYSKSTLICSQLHVPEPQSQHTIALCASFSREAFLVPWEESRYTTWYINIPCSNVALFLVLVCIIGNWWSGPWFDYLHTTPHAGNWMVYYLI